MTFKLPTIQKDVLKSLRHRGFVLNKFAALSNTY